MNHTVEGNNGAQMQPNDVDMNEKGGEAGHTRGAAGGQEAAVVLPYSLDNDFDELRDKDQTTEIIGYVDEIHAAKQVGNNKKYDLYKFVLNNGSLRRITCLVWRKDVIKHVMAKVAEKNILHIEGAVTKATATSFYKATDNLVPFELLIKATTSIANYGKHVIIETINYDDAQQVTFENLGKVRGLIVVEGYVKMTFVKNDSKKDVYVCGSITDGLYKVPVNITSYSGLAVTKGQRVKVFGIIDETAAQTTIICRNDDAIILVEGSPVMSALNLAREVKTPKRGLE